MKFFGLTPTFGNVEIEEVAVEDGLHHTGHHRDLVVELLGVVAPDPVGDVEGAVEAQEEKVVGGDGLRFPRLADHEELREDGHGLQVDGEGPEYLQNQGGEDAGLPVALREDGSQRWRRWQPEVVCSLRPASPPSRFWQ